MQQLKKPVQVPSCKMTTLTKEERIRKETALEALRDALRSTGRKKRPRPGDPGYDAVRVAMLHWHPDFDDLSEKERKALLRSAKKWLNKRNSKPGPHASVDVERHASLRRDIVELLEAAQFTATLYEILEEDKSEVHCHWSDDGERVVFLDSDAFARDVCPRYFRHSKWTSFSRMLNMYEFRKISTSPRNARSTRHEFAHEFFTRDRKDLLNRVQRKRRASPRVEDSPDSDVGQPAP